MAIEKLPKEVNTIDKENTKTNKDNNYGFTN